MDGVDDVALALAADAWSRTYRSRAEAVNALASPVHLRSGLLLRAAPPDASATTVLLDSGIHPACALDHSLQMIGQRYGVATRQWVATQLEYEEEYEDPRGALWGSGSVSVIDYSLRAWGWCTQATAVVIRLCRR